MKLKTAITCKKIVSFRSCIATRSCVHSFASLSCIQLQLPTLSSICLLFPPLYPIFTYYLAHLAPIRFNFPLKPVFSCYFSLHQVFSYCFPILSCIQLRIFHISFIQQLYTPYILHLATIFSLYPASSNYFPPISCIQQLLFSPYILYPGLYPVKRINNGGEYPPHLSTN